MLMSGIWRIPTGLNKFAKTVFVFFGYFVMEPVNVLVDDKAPFGTYEGGISFDKHIKRIRLLPRNWLGKRLMFALRRIAGKHIGDCVDMELFGAKMRLYKAGNASEKRALFAPQFFDYEDRMTLADLAAPDAIFIDIGANIGLYSFSTAQHFKHHKGARIISVEPHPDIHRRLAFNKAQNPGLPIELFAGGIADKAGTMELVTGEDNIGQTRILKNGEETEQATISVPVITLMNLIDKFSLSRIDGMKVDVEGFEEAVLLPFFEKAPDKLLPRLIVVEDNKALWTRDILGAAAKRGFRLAKQTHMNLILVRD